MNRNFSVFFLEELSDQLYDNSFYTSFFIFQGHCTFRVGNEEFNLTENTHFTINYNQPFQLVKKSKNFDYICWASTYDFFINFSKKFPNDKEVNSIVSSIKFKKWSCGFLKINDTETKQLFSNLRYLKLRENEVHRPQLLELKVIEILLYSLMNYREILNLRHLNVRVEHYLKNNLEHASLKDYAKSIFVSESTAANLLKEDYGLTFTALKHQFQLAAASNLLLTTTMNIEDIIQSVGFKNRTYFYKLFYEHYHCSPKQYRSDQSR